MVHSPQCSGSLASCDSQPFAPFPSQLPQPGLQVGVQTPEEHVVEPFALTQMLPHAPQLLVLDAVSVSQPLLALASQLPQPVEQTGVHTPLTHVVEPCEFVQIVPQAPQLVVLVFLSVSHPLFGLPSQLR